MRKRIADLEAKHFDPDRCARVRAKPALARSLEEQAWGLLDQALNPGAWRDKRGRPRVALAAERAPAVSAGDTQGFTVPFPLDAELAQEVDDERKQQVAHTLS